MTDYPSACQTISIIFSEIFLFSKYTGQYYMYSMDLSIVKNIWVQWSDLVLKHGTWNYELIINIHELNDKQY